MSEGNSGRWENDWQARAMARVYGTVVRFRHACAKLNVVRTISSTYAWHFDTYAAAR
jgi:hypothetical protein